MDHQGSPKNGFLLSYEHVELEVLVEHAKGSTCSNQKTEEIRREKVLR